MIHTDLLLHSILDGLPFGAALLDPNRYVLYINAPLSQILGSDTAAWVGQAWEACLVAVGAVAETTTLRVGEHTLWRRQIPLADGASLELLESWPPADTLRDLFVVWDEAAAFHAHELRNPLTAILGYATLLRDRPAATDERRQQWATRSVEKALAMRDSIKLFAESSRFLADRYRFHRVNLDLAQLADEVAQQVTQTTGRAIRVVSVACRVNGDAARLAQLLHILLAQAQSQTPDGSPLTIQVAVVGGQATLTVIDSGPAIAPATQATIFEPQLSLVGAADAGIQLSIARGIAAAHVGTLRLESTPEQGNIFTLTLPLPPDWDVPTE